jgi:hypothetical protein
VGDGLIAVPLDYIRLGLRGGVNLSTEEVRRLLLPYSGGSVMLSEIDATAFISGAGTKGPVL